MSLAPLPGTLQSHTLPVHDSFLHYLEAGSGSPIVLLHGNPTWSYLWRNVIPHLESHGRCIAFDCMGMGRSGKPAIAYRFSDHLAYLAAAIEQLDLTTITLVTHHWGSSSAWLCVGSYHSGCRRWRSSKDPRACAVLAAHCASQPAPGYRAGASGP